MYKNIFAAIGIVSLIVLHSYAGIFSLTESQEIQLGQQAATEVERSNKINTDSTINDYLNAIGQKLVKNSNRPNIQYRFKVINSQTVNAFALPGGYIYIYSGLIKSASNESEFVGVLSHEIAHVTQKHSASQIEKQQKTRVGMNVVGGLLQASGVRAGKINLMMNGASLVSSGVFLKFSREHEREADQVGADLMYRTGWNPNGMITFFEKLAKENSGSTTFFSSHPSPKERYQNIGHLTKAWNMKDKAVDSKAFQTIKAKL